MPRTHPHHRRHPLRVSGGFSLVETLFVMSIMIILFAVAAAGAKKSWQSQELKASAIHLVHDLMLAGQTARRLNQPVEVRFYQYFADAVASDKPRFHAYQLVTRDPVNHSVQPLFELQTLEGTTLISENPRFSSILYPAQSRDSATDPDIGIGEYKYVTVEFRANGTTNLEPSITPWTITLIPVVAADNVGTLPKDFQTLCIHPESGAVHIY